MPLLANCSGCRSQLKFPDKYAGKKVKCPKCEGVIVLPAGASPEPKSGSSDKKAPLKPVPTKQKSAITSSTKSGATKPEDFEFSASPSQRTSRPAPQDDYDEPRDDYDDFDDAAPSASGSGAKIALLCVLAVLVLAGAGFGIWFAIGSNEDDDDSDGPDRERRAEKKDDDDDKKVEKKKEDNRIGNGGPIGIGNGERPPIENRRPPRVGRINSIDDALAALKMQDEREQGNGLTYLARAPLDEKRQNEVSKAIDPFLTSENGTLKSHAFSVAAVWATKDNVPSMLKCMDPKADGIPSDHQKKTIDVVGRLKDPRGVEAVAMYVSNFFEKGRAENAVLAMGTVAEPTMLQWMHDPDGKKRGVAQKMLPLLNVSAARQFEQTLKDLKSKDEQTQKSAMGWLERQTPAADQKANVAKNVAVALLDGDDNVKLSALKVLDKWSAGGSATSVAAMLASDNARVSTEAMRFIDKHGDASCEPAVAKMLAMGEGKANGDREKIAIRYLAKHGDVEGAKALLPYLPNFFAYREVMDALEKIGPKAGPVVATKVCDSNRDMRGRARALLKTYGTEAKIIFPHVREALDSTDVGMQIEAARWLSENDLVPEKQAEVSKILAGFVRSTNGSLRGAGLKAMEVWGTKAEAGILLELAAKSGLGDKDAAIASMNALVKMKDERVVPILILQLGNIWVKGAADKALRDFGPDAELPVLQIMLTTTDSGRLKSMCGILRDIGTSKSTPVLTRVAKYAQFKKDRGLETAVVEAARVIAIRIATNPPPVEDKDKDKDKGEDDKNKEKK